MISRRGLCHVSLLVAVAVLPASVLGPGLVVLMVETAPVPRVMAGMTVILRALHIGYRCRVGLVGRRGVWPGRALSTVGCGWVGVAHWSRRCRLGTVIEAHTDRGSHRLPLVPTAIVVSPPAAASTTAAVRCLVRRLGMTAPLVSGGSGLWSSRWVDRTVVRSGRGRISRLAVGLRLRMAVDLRCEVGVIVLGRQGRVCAWLLGMLLSVLGMPLLLLRSWVCGLRGLRARVGGIALRSVRRSLWAVAIGCRGGLVVAASIRTSSSSPPWRMAASL